MEEFSRYAPIERVKKIRDYAFVHFQTRVGAIKALEGLNGNTIIFILKSGRGAMELYVISMFHTNLNI